MWLVDEMLLMLGSEPWLASAIMASMDKMKRCASKKQIHWWFPDTVCTSQKSCVKSTKHGQIQSQFCLNRTMWLRALLNKVLCCSNALEGLFLELLFTLWLERGCMGEHLRRVTWQRHAVWGLDVNVSQDWSTSGLDRMQFEGLRWCDLMGMHFESTCCLEAGSWSFYYLNRCFGGYRCA